MKILLKTFVLMLPLCAATGTAVAQTEVLNAPLKDFGTVNVNIPQEPAGYTGWNFENCMTAKEEKYDDIWVQVGNETEAGTLTTPELNGLKGNARISFNFYTTEANETLYVKDENDKQIEYFVPTKAKSWNKTSPVLYTKGNSSSKLKFCCDGGDDATHRFFIANILVLDIGDAIYYESFNNVSGTGGNDNIYTNLLLGNNPVTTTKLDYPTSVCNTVYAANQCIFISSGTFETEKIPVTESTNCILSFRVAGTTKSEHSQLNVLNGSSNIAALSYDNGTLEIGEWQTVQLPLSNVTKNSTITFDGKFVLIDDVAITPRNSITLNETDDNAEKLATHSGKIADVTLGRTLTADIWNTLCLPFTFSLPALRLALGTNEGRDLDLELRRLQSVNDGVFTFSTATEIPAGEPFLVKPNKTVSNVTFSGITIEAPVPGRVEPTEGYALQGIYSPTDLNTDGTHIFLGTDGYLYTPAASANRMNGLRAYLTIPADAQAARVSIEEATPEAITIPTHGEAQQQSYSTVYNLCGQPMPGNTRQLPKGLYITGGKKLLIK